MKDSRGKHDAAALEGRKVGRAKRIDTETRSFLTCTQGVPSSIC